MMRRYIPATMLGIACIEKMAGRRIGRGGPIAWPPRSPDLTPLDSFLVALCEVHYLSG
jgi:hypothetical protein